MRETSARTPAKEHTVCTFFLRSTWNIDLFIAPVELLEPTGNVPRGTFRRMTKTAALAHCAQARLWDSESCPHSSLFVPSCGPCSLAEVFPC